MQTIRAFKYLSPSLMYITAWLAFSSYGWLCWLPMMYAWIVIPGLELLIKPDMRNLGAAEEEIAKQNRLYDYFLYVILPLQYVALFFFLYGMKQDELHWTDALGRTLSMGMLCGTFGINVAHELGHRIKPAEQWMAKLLLLTSLYMHFFTEHNKGHHKRVATPEDPSSARLGEMVYTFYFRTIIFSYLSAWHIANEETRKKGKPVFSLYNEMVQATLLQAAFVAGIYFAFGGAVTLYFMGAALMGILLLETVNYIEHYGLSRKKTGEGKYERAMPQHSWNSNHVIGRIMLFELSRHSDHHYLASRKYQVLRHHDDAPQMPTGYPGMMLLSLAPPAWFYVMHKKLREMEGN
jgi:alkane 1-monooxygenase